MEEKQEFKQLEKLLADKHITTAKLHGLIDMINNPVNQPKAITHDWSSDWVRFGLMGDTHIGSKYADWGQLEDMYKRFKKEGCDCVYHTGDMTEGYGRRKGHAFECDLHGVDAQVEAVINHYPDSVDTYFILGDHDGWHYQNAGVDIGKIIDSERSDMHYIGDCWADINIGGKTKLSLMHPSKGTAYALSYHAQKIIESLSGGQKPHILALGHYHKIEYLFYRNVHAFQTGCVQNQSAWMKRMNLSAHKGGWIVDVFMKKNGHPDRLDMTLLPYYE